MRAMILAAGRGERLRPLTERIPKPLAPIGGEPLILHQLRWLRRAGVREAVVNVHHLAERIEAAVGSGAGAGVRVCYSREDALLDTGGGIVRALPLLGSEPFIVLNGDIWTGFAFERLLSARPAKAHLVLKPAAAATAGDFRFEAGRVRRDGARDLTYCGIAVLHPALFAAAPPAPFSLRELLFAAADAGELEGEAFDGMWIDIGTPQRLRQARLLHAQGIA